MPTSRQPCSHAGRQRSAWFRPGQKSGRLSQMNTGGLTPATWKLLAGIRSKRRTLRHGRPSGRTGGRARDRCPNGGETACQAPVDTTRARSRPCRDVPSLSFGVQFLAELKDLLNAARPRPRQAPPHVNGSASEPKRFQPGINLTKCVPLPLVWVSVTKNLTLFNKSAYAGRPKAIECFELRIDEGVAVHSVLMFQKRAQSSARAATPPG